MEAHRGGGGRGENHDIIFFKVETNVPGYMSSSFELLEFGAVVLDARGLAELCSFHTFIRPTNLSCIDRRTSDCNNITSATVADAPAFSAVADDIYKLLHGHIWAGHNISRFSICHLNKAFSRIGMQAPQAAGVIDTYPLLRKTFGQRAGNCKLATLADYCGSSREEEHRSIAGIRKNINVLRNCATVMFLESNYPAFFVTTTTSTPMLESPTTTLTKYYSHVKAMVSDSKCIAKGGEDMPHFRLHSDEPAANASSSISRLLHARPDFDIELSDATKSLRKRRLTWEPKDGKLEKHRNLEVLVHSKDVMRERDFPECLSTPPLTDKHMAEASAGCTMQISKLANLDRRTNFEGIRFLSASDVNLPSISCIEAGEPYGCDKLMLYYKGFPLHLLELKMRVRFTINLSYAFDEKGKPRFSLLIEPSESACNVISRCEDVVKTMSASDGEVEWLPALIKKESGRWAAHMTIGTTWGSPNWTYTTKFYRSTSNGLKQISLGHVDASTFRNEIPHGSVIDVGFGFYVFNVKHHIKGVRLLANNITLT